MYFALVSHHGASQVIHFSADNHGEAVAWMAGELVKTRGLRVLDYGLVFDIRTPIIDIEDSHDQPTNTGANHRTDPANAACP